MLNFIRRFLIDLMNEDLFEGDIFRFKHAKVRLDTNTVKGWFQPLCCKKNKWVLILR